MSTAGQDGLVDGELPSIEVPTRIIKHYNRTPQAMKGFKQAGYFVFNNVRVFEVGHKEELERKDRLTSEQVVFGK